MSASFAGRHAVVTGAASGIGRRTAEALAERGATVACLDRDGDRLEEVVAALGGAATGHVADVTSSAQVDAAFDAAAATASLDLVVNIAGAALMGAVHELSDEDWADCLGRNLTGTFYCCRAAVRHLGARGGVIVNMSSSLGRIAAPRFAAYSAAKAGVRALTMQMARDYGPAIRVNSVSPAATDTPGVRYAIESAADPAAVEAEIAGGNHIAGRLATTDEVVAGILFAASAESSFMFGHDLVLCGGQTTVAY
ncbi:MAG: SDR family oxidoreductase [Nocardioidaceae bacterium]|nr:SDR family oxidoreductase [Nocardioidaceae bacterium]